jgi:hypothetical protein
MVTGARIYQKTVALLDKVVLGTHTVRYLLVAAGIAFAFLVLLQFILSAFRKAENRRHVQKTSCPSCGWKGKVSIYAGRCPQCNEPLGDRKARPKA